MTVTIFSVFFVAYFFIGLVMSLLELKGTFTFTRSSVMGLLFTILGYTLGLIIAVFNFFIAK